MKRKSRSVWKRRVREWLVHIRVGLCILPGSVFCAKIWQGYETGDAPFGFAAALFVCTAAISLGLAYLQVVTDRNPTDRHPDTHVALFTDTER